MTLLLTAGFPVGDSVAPFDTAPPYGVLNLVGGPPPEGSLSDYMADATFRYQVTSIGITREQAQMLADKFRAVMIRESLTVTGRRVMMLQLDTTIGLDRDEQGVPSPYYLQVDQYLVMTTPN